MFSNRSSIKKKSDFEAIFGKKLSNAILKEFGGGQCQKKPKNVYFYDSKPSFALSRGDTLYACGLDLESETITGKKYCGSEDSAMHHLGEQFGEGGCPENGYALIFVQSYWNGVNHSWDVSVVSKNITKQVSNE